MIVKKGSSLELRCLVNRGEMGRLHESMAVFWYLNSRVIDWTGQTGPGRGAHVEEEPRNRQLESVLRVERARLEHDGIFTCGPSLGIEDSIRVHVIDGKLSYFNRDIARYRWRNFVTCGINLSAIDSRLSFMSKDASLRSKLRP